MKEVYDEKDVVLASILKALAHPARLAIIRILSRKDTCVCGQIVDEMPLAQSTVSQHLKELKDVGLISGEVEGVRTCYCLNMEKIKEIKKDLMELIESVSTKCCG